MAENNILNGGLEVLAEMRRTLFKLQESEARSASLAVEENKFEKLIQVREKAMNDEISNTIKKRQDEISFSFDEQIDQTRIKLKKVKSKRDKFKNEKVTERIDVETKDLQEDKRKLREEIKSIFKVNHISSIFNNKLFYSLHMPGEITDFLVALLTIAIVLFLPFFIWKLAPEENETIFRIVIYYIIAIGVFCGIYFLIHKKVREPNLVALKQIQGLRAKLHTNDKAIKTVQKAIKKDPDESGYGLESYDTEMDDLDAQICDIAEKKKEALTVFENETKINITNEIKLDYESEINKNRKELERTHKERREAEDAIKDLKLTISNKYESYVGKEYCTIAMIDSLSDIIKAGDAINIADAVKFYERQLTEAINAQKNK